MHDVSTIESINREQLATASDRLLLRGRVWHRAQTRMAAPAAPAAPPARGSSPAIPVPHARFAEGSQAQIVVSARRTQHPLPPVRTARMRVVRPPVATSSVRRVGVAAATAAVIAIPTLVGFAIGLAAVL
jgi:hypothetical protein